MKQSRLMSLVESLANVLVGYGVAVATQMAVFPLFGVAVSITENLVIGLIFTVVSIVRSYALRRSFEALRVRQSAHLPTADAVNSSL
jgi:membrane protein CcdC involved in cytochrome C biogenesis